MPLGRVAGNEIENYFYFVRVRFGNEAIEIVERSEQRIDIAIVADVVSEIRHRRGINRRYPDRVGAEPREVVEAIAYSLQIADAVAIRVLKGTRIDLIDDPVLPPDKIGHAQSSRISWTGRYPVQLAAACFSSLTTKCLGR